MLAAMESSDELRDRFQFEEDTAGGIMSVSRRGMDWMVRMLEVTSSPVIPSPRVTARTSSAVRPRESKDIEWFSAAGLPGSCRDGLGGSR